MKDIKSFLIGFLSCVCLMLFMGHTSSNNNIGRYQAFGDIESPLLIDTTTGKLHFIQKFTDENIFEWHWIELKKSDVFTK
tara:strand:+ start:1266 stop:1505 length:240 start_codon:yes stop_codon:yes gene_type:complete